MAQVKILDLNIDSADPNGFIYEMLKIIRPDWGRDDTVIEPLTGGHANTTMCCHLSSDEDKNDWLVVRIHGDALGEVMDRDADVMGVQIAAQQGIGPPVHCIFNNGFCCGFAKGRLFVYADFFNPNVMRSMTEACAKLNFINLETTTCYNMKGQMVKVPKIRSLHNIEYFKGALSRKLNDPARQKRREENLPSTEEWISEFHKVLEKLASLNLPKVITHGDMNVNNWLYDDQNDVITLLDFDLMGVDVIGSDLANIFVGANAIYHMVEKGQGPVFDDEVRGQYCRAYLEAYVTLHGQDVEATITDQRVHSFQTLVKHLATVYLFLLSTFMFSQEERGTLRVVDCLEIPIGTYAAFRSMREAFYEYKSDLDWLPRFS